MVLTNFECWAHGGSGDGPLFVDTAIERRNPAAVDLFNPSALSECGDPSANDSPKFVSHLSSNGYYGFAPVCRAANGNDAPTIGGDDVKCIAQQHSDSAHMMDVEQHCVSHVPSHVPNSPPSANVASAADVKAFRNGFLGGRRKRFFIEEEYYQTQRNGAKRCRFDRQREQYLTESHNGGCPSTYAPTTMFPLSMEHDEFPIAVSNSSSDGYATAARTGDSSFTSEQQRLVVNSTGDASSNSKSNFSSNYKYNDISRCMLSHMI